MELNRKLPNKPKYLWSIYNKGYKNIRFGKDSVFNNWGWENWTATYEKMKEEHFSHAIYKSKFKMN